MSTVADNLSELTSREYKYGFVTEIEADSAPPGLNEEIIRFISAKKNEPDFMLEWRLRSYRARMEAADVSRSRPAKTSSIVAAREEVDATKASPVSVAGLLDGKCYQWIQTLGDRAGNSSATTSGTIRIALGT